MVGADQLLAGQLVESLSEPLGQSPAVGEDDGAPVAADQLEDPRVDRRPDARSHVPARRRPAGLLVERQHLAHRRHVVDRHHDLEIERLPRARVDDRDLAAGPDPAEEPGDRVERSLRGRQTDPLHRREARPGRLRRAVSEGLEPLEAEGEMGAAFGARDGMDLVDDDVLDPAQDLTRGAREHQVERFGGRDQDVGRVTCDLPAVLRGRIAGPAGDRDPRHGFAKPLGRQGDPGQRRPQVTLDVVGQRLERRDVQDAHQTG